MTEKGGQMNKNLVSNIGYIQQIKHCTLFYTHHNAHLSSRSSLAKKLQITQHSRISDAGNHFHTKSTFGRRYSGVHLRKGGFRQALAPMSLCSNKGFNIFWSLKKNSFCVWQQDRSIEHCHACCNWEEVVLLALIGWNKTPN